MALGPVGRTVVVLLVEDERGDPLALAHVVDLRPGELRVHIDGAQAGLRRGIGRVGEAAVVAAEDRDRVARLDPVRHPRVRERVRALVDLAVGERAELVHERRSRRRSGSPRRVAAAPNGPRPATSRAIRAILSGRDGARMPERAAAAVAWAVVADLLMKFRSKAPRIYSLEV